MKLVNIHKQLVLAVSFGIGMGSCGSSDEVAQPIRQDITETIFASGELEVDDAYFLVAQVEGYLQEVRFREGDEVQRGDVFAVVDNQVNEVANQNAQRQWELAQQNAAISGPTLRQIAANLSSAEQKVAFDSLQAIRFRRLAQTEAVAKIEAEKADLAYQASRKAKESIVEQYKAAKLIADQQVITQRNQAQINRVIQQYNQIKAPTGGRVWQVLKEPGDYVRRGDLIARIGKSEQLYARLAVDEGSIAKVKVGQQVWIRLNTHPDSVTEGVVSEIAPLFDPAKQAYTVKVTWKGKIPIEIIGTQLEANLLVQKRSQVLVIPRSYLGYGQKVWKEGDPEPTAIQIGFVSDEWVEVTGGLSESDRLVRQKR